jgi:hypothetical protein
VLGRAVAIKVLSPAIAANRFIHEARAASALNHPNRRVEGCTPEACRKVAGGKCRRHAATGCESALHLGPGRGRVPISGTPRGVQIFAIDTGGSAPAALAHRLIYVTPPACRQVAKASYRRTECADTLVGGRGPPREKTKRPAFAGLLSKRSLMRFTASARPRAAPGALRRRSW